MLLQWPWRCAPLLGTCSWLRLFPQCVFEALSQLRVHAFAAAVAVQAMPMVDRAMMSHAAGPRGACPLSLGLGSDASQADNVRHACHRGRRRSSGCGRQQHGLGRTQAVAAATQVGCRRVGAAPGGWARGGVYALSFWPCACAARRKVCGTGAAVAYMWGAQRDRQRCPTPLPCRTMPLGRAACRSASTTSLSCSAGAALGGSCRAPGAPWPPCPPPPPPHTHTWERLAAPTAAAACRLNAPAAACTPRRA
jgi:hypothetical protein